MNSNCNIALLADYEQVVNAKMNTKPKPSPDTSGTNTDQTTPKEPSMSQDQTAPSFTEDTVNNHKSGVTGHVLPLQCQHPGPVRSIPVGYESDDSWDTALTAAFEAKDKNVALLTYRYQNSNPTAHHRGGQRGHFGPHGIPRCNKHEPGPRPWDNHPYSCCTRSQEALCAQAYKKWAKHRQQYT